MIVQPLVLAFLVGFADAFVPAIPRRPSVVLFRKRSYLDDLGGDPEPADDNSSPGDESPKSEYLEDMSVKEAESQNESPSDDSVDEDEAEPFKSPASPTESVEETLEDMSMNEAESPDEPPSDVSVEEDEVEPIKSTASPTESVEKTFESMSMNEAESLDEPPSDVSVDEDEAGPVKSPVSLTESVEKTLTTLLQISASTGRGEFATSAQKEQASSLISALELQNPTPEPTNSPLINGRWELLYSSTQLFRSSPFFMAGRAVCSTPEQAKQYDWFCEMHRKSLAISSIGQVRQVVSPTSLVSEFEVKVGAVPFLSDFTPFAYSGGSPVTIEGAIVSSADISPTDNGNAWELYMDTVEIKGSNMPGLRQFLDKGLKLTSRQLGDFLESNVDSYTNPRPVFSTTYLSEMLRISRDQDGKMFVYGKMTDDTEPTDYSGVKVDRGVLKLFGVSQ